nr:uncharacterized protein LOC127315128 [Lolium perenne]
MSWVMFVVVSGGGSGGVGGEGNGGGAPRLVDAFTFVLFGAEFFGVARAAFGFVATAETSPVAVAVPDCGTTCVPARCRFTRLVDETVVATSAGVAGVSGVAGVVGGAAEAPTTTAKGGGAEEGEGAQIGGVGGWEELKVPSRAK